MWGRGMGKKKHGIQITFLSDAYGSESGVCNCHLVLANVLKQQAIARKRVQIMLRKGLHPYEHSVGNPGGSLGVPDLCAEQDVEVSTEVRDPNG